MLDLNIVKKKFIKNNNNTKFRYIWSFNNEIIDSSNIMVNFLFKYNIFS